jgi:peptidoglycan/LPS O-acetylase OafA/YrhL
MNFRWLKNALARDTTSGAFIPQIDGLRFIAIGAVIAYHVADFVRVKTGHAWSDGALSLFLSHGYFGVPLFFVISGFVISLPFVERTMAGRPAPSLKRYFLRRLTRLEPPYLINLLLLFGLLVVVKDQSASELFPHLLASMTYTHNAIYNEFSAINFLAWSLEVEFQFYALAPLLVLLFRVRSLPLRRGLLLALIVLFGLAANDLAAAGLLPRLALVYYIAYFFAGFLLADVYVNDWREKPPTRPAFDLVSLASWGTIALCLYRPDDYRALLPMLVFGAYWGAFRGTVSSWFFSQPIIHIIGGMCYTLYLYHFYVVSAIGNPALGRVVRHTDDLTTATLLTLLLVTPVVLLSGAVLFALFEKPFMRRLWFEAFMRWFNGKRTTR